ISFPCSDGDSNTWPLNVHSNRDADGQVNYMRVVDDLETIHVKYRKGVANAIATSLDFPVVKPGYILAAFPNGYKMYEHMKGHYENPRRDIYIFGRPGSRFRSINEMIPHAVWLFRNMQGDCECKYCTKKPQREITSSMAGIMTTAGSSPRPGPRHKATRRGKAPPEPPKLYASIQRIFQPLSPSPGVLTSPSEDSGFPMLPERDADVRAVRGNKMMHIMRWFREGEVVWCRLPSLVMGRNPDGSDAIRFWPGVIEQIMPKSRALHDPVSDDMVIGSQNSRNPPWKIQQYTIYKVKLLAVEQSPPIEDMYILPYHAHVPSDELVHTFSSTPLDLDKDKIKKFMPFPEGDAPVATFVDAVTPFVLAVQMASKVTFFWCPTDEWEFQFHLPPPSASRSASTGPQTSSQQQQLPGNPSGLSDTLTPSEVASIGARVLGEIPVGRSATQKRFQGLWWGSERIWVSDFVRLKLERANVAPHGVTGIHPPAGPGPTVMERIQDELENVSEMEKEKALYDRGAAKRGVFMRLDALIVVNVPVPQEGRHRTKKEIRMAGPLFELVDEDWHEPSDKGKQKATASDAEATKDAAPTDTYLLPLAPANYKFRRISAPGYECVMSLTLLSGRYYPRILQHELLRDEVQEGLQNPREYLHLWALEGLAAGFNNSVDPTISKPDRISILRDASMEAR
ncbi:hypothetical protein FISHEDRAFT_13262, partial [Fistulina hepatica ATCC 64428]